MVEGATGGRPACFCEAVSALDGCRLPVLSVPGVSRGYWHRGVLRTELSGIATSIILYEIIYVV